jgi:hypothetical protein
VSTGRQAFFQPSLTCPLVVTTQRVRHPRHAAPSILGDDRAGRVAWAPPPLSSAARVGCSLLGRLGLGWLGLGCLLGRSAAGRSVGCSLARVARSVGRSGCSVGLLGRPLAGSAWAGCSVGWLGRLGSALASPCVTPSHSRVDKPRRRVHTPRGNPYSPNPPHPPTYSRSRCVRVWAT